MCWQCSELGLPVPPPRSTPFGLPRVHVDLLSKTPREARHFQVVLVHHELTFPNSPGQLIKYCIFKSLVACCSLTRHMLIRHLLTRMWSPQWDWANITQWKNVDSTTNCHLLMGVGSAAHQSWPWASLPTERHQGLRRRVAVWIRICKHFAEWLPWARGPINRHSLSYSTNFSFPRVVLSQQHWEILGIILKVWPSWGAERPLVPLWFADNLNSLETCFCKILFWGENIWSSLILLLKIILSVPVER